MKLLRKNKNPQPARPFEMTTIQADQQRVNEVTRATRRRMAQGEAMRCAACLNWQSAQSAQIGVYISPDGQKYTGYALCPKCAALVQVSESVRRSIAAYVAGTN